MRINQLNPALQKAAEKDTWEDKTNENCTRANDTGYTFGKLFSEKAIYKEAG